MANNHTNDNIEQFHVFNYTETAFKNCTNAMDTPTRENQSDAESNKLCCDEMFCCFCWPITLLVDILSCPFRGCIHLKKKCSK